VAAGCCPRTVDVMARWGTARRVSKGEHDELEIYLPQDGRGRGGTGRPPGARPARRSAGAGRARRARRGCQRWHLAGGGSRRPRPPVCSGPGGPSGPGLASARCLPCVARRGANDSGRGTSRKQPRAHRWAGGGDPLRGLGCRRGEQGGVGLVLLIVMHESGTWRVRPGQVLTFGRGAGCTVTLPAH
jgi:hypothetical protein